MGSINWVIAWLYQGVCSERQRDSSWSWPALIFPLVTLVSFIFIYISGNLIGADRSHVFIMKGVKISLAVAFNLEAVNTYRPISVFLEHFFTSIYHPQNYTYHVYVVLMASFLNGFAAVIFFTIGRVILRSNGWALFATTLIAFTTAHLVSTWYILFSVFEILPLITVCGGLLGYIKYRQKGGWGWLLLFISLSLVGPWCREIGLVPGIVATGIELIRFPKYRSYMLWLSFGLALHGLFPTAIPHMLGWYQHDIQFLMHHGEIAANFQHQQINWIRAGRIANEVAPVLWFGVITASGIFVATTLASGIRLKAWYGGLCEKGLPFTTWSAASKSSPGFRWRLAGLGVAACYVAFALYAILTLFHPGPEPHTSTVHIYQREIVLILFLPILMVISGLRMGFLIPLWFMANYPSMLRFLANHETHQLFISVPMGLIVTFWIKELFEHFGKLPQIIVRRSLLVLATPAILLGFLDQVGNIPSAYMTHVRIKAGLERMADWLRSNTKPGSLVLVNFFPAFDIMDRTGGHVNMRWISSFGPISHLPDHRPAYEYKEQLKLISQAVAEKREIFYLLLLSKNFEGQYLLPQAKLERLATFEINLRHTFIDPLRRWVAVPSYVKYFGPMHWVSTFDQMHPFIGINQWPTIFQAYRLNRHEAQVLAERPIPQVWPGSPPLVPSVWDKYKPVRPPPNPVGNFAIRWPGNIAMGGKPRTSDFQPPFLSQHINDGQNNLSWGSTGRVEVEPYAVITFDAPVTPKEIMISLYSEGGRAHLKEISVVASVDGLVSSNRWKIINARISGTGSFSKKVTVPALKDASTVILELDRNDPNFGSYRTIGIASFPISKGYDTNYIAGNALYIRELGIRKLP